MFASIKFGNVIKKKLIKPIKKKSVSLVLVRFYQIHH
jgi:hypothetical protein